MPKCCLTPEPQKSLLVFHAEKNGCSIAYDLMLSTQCKILSILYKHGVDSMIHETMSELSLAKIHLKRAQLSCQLGPVVRDTGSNEIARQNDHYDCCLLIIVMTVNLDCLFGAVEMFFKCQFMALHYRSLSLVHHVQYTTIPRQSSVFHSECTVYANRQIAFRVPIQNSIRIINDCERNGHEYGTIRELSHWSIQQGAQRRVE